jgi:hypothetical protein
MADRRPYPPSGWRDEDFDRPQRQRPRSSGLDYNPFDARAYDSGGFGFGGTSGSGGGYGAGGMGPQGGYASQANAGQGYSPSDYDPDNVNNDAATQGYSPRGDWTDGLPHHVGWGPRTPDYGRDPQRDLGYTQRFQGAPEQDYGRHRHRNYAREADRWNDRHPDDYHYLSWREEQMRSLDNEYHAYNEERRGRFNDEFDGWRKRRAEERAKTSTGAASDASDKRDFSKSRT